MSKIDYHTFKPVLFEFPVSIMLWYQFFLLSFKNYVIVSSQLS